MINAQQKIGIVTIQGRFNFGNRLQNYAVDHIFRQRGFLPESLILERPLPPSQMVKKTAKKLLGRDRPTRESQMSAERLAAFDRFNAHLNLRIVRKLDEEFVNEFRYFSAGSDQIWGMSRSSFGEDWRFLQFSRPEQRIALAPSFGTDSPLTSPQLKRLARYMQGYPSISVREESGASFIKEASGKDVAVICDPTMVLDAAKWRSVQDGRLTPTGEYVFAYLLGSESDEAKIALDVATRNGELPVVFLSDRERLGEPPAGPAEFISLVDNASWVVTDSFHGSVYASILQRPLTIVHRGGGHAMYSNMFGRLETLSKKLGITHKVYGSPDFDFARARDYDGVPEAIDRERKKFVGYLEARLDA